MQRAFVLLLVAAVTLVTPASASGWPSPIALAQDAPDAPELGDVILVDPLQENGVVRDGRCATGRNHADFVPDGFRLLVTGRCIMSAPNATIRAQTNGLSFPDGELRLDFRMSSGHDRLVLALVVRSRGANAPGYSFLMAPGTGVARIVKFLPMQPGALLSQRTDLRTVIRRDEWNTVSMRVLGTSLWLLLSDRPVLSAEDGSYLEGSILMTVGRLGRPDDDEEAVMLLRDVRLSAIDGAPDSRAPTFGPQPGAPPGPPAEPPTDNPGMLIGSMR